MVRYLPYQTKQMAKRLPHEIDTNRVAVWYGSMSIVLNLFLFFNSFSVCPERNSKQTWSPSAGSRKQVLKLTLPISKKLQAGQYPLCYYKK